METNRTEREQLLYDLGYYTGKKHGQKMAERKIIIFYLITLPAMWLAIYLIKQIFNL